MFTEADVNTATPSLSNAAATWAGWAVTAVTAKFYRSQSDTVKSSLNPLTSKTLSKPGSLGTSRLILCYVLKVINYFNHTVASVECSSTLLFAIHCIIL